MASKIRILHPPHQSDRSPEQRGQGTDRPILCCAAPSGSPRMTVLKRRGTLWRYGDTSAWRLGGNACPEDAGDTPVSALHTLGEY
jgi:hypothetical protein